MNINSQDESVILEAVKKDYRLLRYIKSQTEEMCLAAVEQDNFVFNGGYALEYVHNQTEKICLAAVKKNGLVLRLVKDKTEEICIEALLNNGMAIRSVKEQTEKLCHIAVTSNGDALRFVENQTKEMCLIAVRKNGLNLQYVKEQTEEICLAAVNQNGYALMLCKYKTFDICLAAVKQNSLSYRHRNRNLTSEEDEALRFASLFACYDANGLVLQYFYNPTYEDCFAAVRRDGMALQFVDSNIKGGYKPYKYLCLAAVRQNGLALQFVKETVSEEDYSEIHQAAVKQNKASYDFSRYKSIQDGKTSILPLDEMILRSRNSSIRIKIGQRNHRNLWKSADEYIGSIEPHITLSKLSFVPEKEHTLEVCVAAVKQDIKSLWDANQTHEMCLFAINLWQPGQFSALQYIREQTEEMCLIAVRQSGSHLRHVHNQTEKICLAAVNQDGLALKYVQNQTPEICKAAIKNNINAVRYAKANVFNKVVKEPGLSLTHPIGKIIDYRIRSAAWRINFIILYSVLVIFHYIAKMPR